MHMFAPVHHLMPARPRSKLTLARQKMVLTQHVASAIATVEYVGFRNQNARFPLGDPRAALSFHGRCDARCCTTVGESRGGEAKSVGLTVDDEVWLMRYSMMALSPAE